MIIKKTTIRTQEWKGWDAGLGLRILFFGFNQKVENEKQKNSFDADERCLWAFSVVEKRRFYFLPVHMAIGKVYMRLMRIFEYYFI